MWRWSGRFETLDVTLADDEMSHGAGHRRLTSFVGMDFHPRLRIGRFVCTNQHPNRRKCLQRGAQRIGIRAAYLVVHVQLVHCASVSA